MPHAKSAAWGTAMSEAAAGAAMSTASARPTTPTTGRAGRMHMKQRAVQSMFFRCGIVAKEMESRLFSHKITPPFAVYSGGCLFGIIITVFHRRSINKF